MHFLRTSCAPSVGLYLAMTGARLQGGDLQRAGLATHLLAPADAADAAPGRAGSALAAAVAGRPPSEVDAVLAAVGAAAGLAEGSAPAEDSILAPPNQRAIDLAFSVDLPHAQPSVASVVAALEAMAAEATAAPVVATALDALRSACPTSVAAAFFAFTAAHALPPLKPPPVSRLKAEPRAEPGGPDGGTGGPRAGEASVVEACRALELLVCGRLLRRADFAEGVACAVGAKRGAMPAWSPSTWTARAAPGAPPPPAGECDGAVSDGADRCPAELGGDLGDVVESLAGEGLTLAKARDLLLAEVDALEASKRHAASAEK